MTIKTRRRYTEAFKAEAVRLICDAAWPVAQVDRDLGAADYLLYRWRGLRAQGHRVGAHRVARLMRHDGLRAKTVKPWRATTPSSHRVPVESNSLDHQFMV